MIITINNGFAAGAPGLDILGNPRVGEPNAGAYENQDPLGIETIDNDGQLALMPNPAHANTNISLLNDWIGNIQRCSEVRQLLNSKMFSQNAFDFWKVKKCAAMTGFWEAGVAL